MFEQRDELSELQVWARDLTTAYQAARQLVTTSFVPDSYRNKPEEAAAAIMTGQEIGLSPLASLRSIDIINGVPGMRAIALRALVQSHGHEIWVEEQTKTRAIVKGRRKGTDRIEVSVWDEERARGLNLLGKSNYKSQPGAMYVARATSECARLVDADGILGIPYSTEELLDLDPAVVEDAPRKAPARRTVKRAALPVTPAAEPPLPGELESPEGLEPNQVSEPETAAEHASERDPAEPTPEELDAPVDDVPESPIVAAEPVSWTVASIPGSGEPPLDWEPPAEDGY